MTALKAVKKPNSKLAAAQEAIKGIADHHRVNTAVERLLAVIVEQDARIAKLETAVKALRRKVGKENA